MLAMTAMGVAREFLWMTLKLHLMMQNLCTFRALVGWQKTLEMAN